MIVKLNNVYYKFYKHLKEGLCIGCHHKVQKAISNLWTTYEVNVFVDFPLCEKFVKRYKRFVAPYLINDINEFDEGGVWICDKCLDPDVEDDYSLMRKYLIPFEKRLKGEYYETFRNHN